VILVLRALGVGDLAAAVPALRGLRTAYPGRRLVLAAPQWLTPLIDLVGGIDEVVATDGLGARRLPTAGIAVNLHGRGPESHRLLQRTHPGALWAFANREAGHPTGPRWIEEEHEVRRWCRLLSGYGVDTDESDLDLTVPPRPVPAGLTVIHAGAKAAARRWPPDRFAAVARALAERGHRVVVTGSAAERHLAVRVAEAAGLPPRAVLAGRTGLGDLAALVAHGRLVISGDTGIAHLATAYRTPSVVLFGPMPPARWGPPPGRPYHRAIWHGTRAEPGDGPGATVHPALLRITVEEVLAAAGEVERSRHAVAAQ
jgi:ADP-heptose:LPS heptosyltransferase